VKHLKTVFNALRGAIIVFLALVSTSVNAQTLTLADMDSVEVSLLTCQPHDEVYSLYGHTAIRYHDLRKKNMDVALNYGVFNFNAPFFALRFVFGLTDYELGAYPYKYFPEEYRQFGSMVTEQVLNLTGEEKLRLYHLLSENMRPANRVYRYNFFYNNCTTKARDVIEQCITGEVKYSERKDYTPSYREMVHEMTRDYPWSRFGNDVLLGIMADQPTDRRQQEFLPYNLMYDFDHAHISDNGHDRPLVKERRIASPAGVQVRQAGFPLSPTALFACLLAVGVLLFVIEWRRGYAILAWDVLLMTVSGIIGIVLFLMLFSQHPTVSLNLQILLFNPVHWLFLWSVIKGKRTRYWYFTAAMCILFLIGSLFQSYAEGIICLALCLLMQSVLHLCRKRK
jgi:hypothetical protein